MAMGERETKKETPMGLSQNLKRLRDEAHMTQLDLAISSGIHPSQISNIETGREPNPKLDTIKRLAAGIGCRPEDLIGSPEPVESVSPCST